MYTLEATYYPFDSRCRYLTAAFLLNDLVAIKQGHKNRCPTIGQEFTDRKLLQTEYHNGQDLF
jgi:hypothetical protein